MIAMSTLLEIFYVSARNVWLPLGKSPSFRAGKTLKSRVVPLQQVG
jgi:hypothetical protein